MSSPVTSDLQSPAPGDCDSHSQTIALEKGPRWRRRDKSGQRQSNGTGIANNSARRPETQLSLIMIPLYFLSCSLYAFSLQISEKPVASTSIQESRPIHDREVACYFSSWAVYRDGDGQFGINNINPSLCTNLIYAFAGLNENTSTIRNLDDYNDLEVNYGKERLYEKARLFYFHTHNMANVRINHSGSFKKINELRKAHPHLTVSLAIGGWNEGSFKYSQLAKDSTNRSIFINSVVDFLRTHDFNGFDLDWEFPTKRGGASEDNENFVKLVKELHEALSPKGWRLTAALGAGKDTVETAYNLPELNKYLDYIHLMCYDYHGIWDKVTGANAPLHPPQPGDVNNVEFSVQYMLDHGVSPHKLLLGLPMYGRTFKLNTTQPQRVDGDQLGAASLKTSFSGPYTKEDGFMGYNEICVELEGNSSWKKMWDESTMTPFARDGDKIITYDDDKSLALKVEYAMRKKLGGVMIWSIETDDFMSNCKISRNHTFPLLTSVNKAIVSSLQEIDKEEKETEATSTTTSKPTSTATSEQPTSTATSEQPTSTATSEQPSMPKEPNSAPAMAISTALVLTYFLIIIIF